MYGCQTGDVNGTCTACFTGFQLNQNNTCDQLPVGCSTADQNGVCTQCFDGWGFYSNTNC